MDGGCFWYERVMGFISQHPSGIYWTYCGTHKISWTRNDLPAMLGQIIPARSGMQVNQENHPENRQNACHPDAGEIPPKNLVISCSITSESLKKSTAESRKSDLRIQLGLSENSVSLHPMVLLIIIPTFYGYFIGGIPHFQTYPDSLTQILSKIQRFAGWIPSNPLKCGINPQNPSGDGEYSWSFASSRPRSQLETEHQKDAEELKESMVNIV